MPRIKAFLREHLLWVGFLVVMLPLLALLLLQYRSLTALEAAMPARRKEEMAAFLQAVIKEVDDSYRREADRALALPTNTISNRVNGLVVIHGELNAMNVLPPVAAAAGHFRVQQFPGAKSYFFAIKILHNQRTYCGVLLYDDVLGVIKRDLRSPLWTAGQQASFPFCSKISRGIVEPPGVVGVRVEPNYHFLLKPVAGEDGTIIAAAGAELDQQYFHTTLLPTIIHKVTAQYFPAQQQDVVVTLRDGKNQLLWSSQSDAPTQAEAQISSELVFRDWKLGVRRRGLTEAQSARRVFLLNISLSVLMALLLSGGLWLALRTATRAMKLSQMKSDFVSNVSHELRTPLSSIRVFGELLKHGRADDPAVAREFGAYIETESRRLTQLINNILDFSHIESGRKEYQFAPTDLRALIAETVKAYEVRLKHEGFELRLATTPTPLVAVDAEAIAQAFVNLLDNAAKYSGSARVIEVRVQSRAEAVTIAVTDHGIGIAPEEQAKIFEKFYRVSTGFVHDVKGSGLGLSIVCHIVEAHRGQVTVESEPAHGSTFMIHLPLPANADETVDAVVALQPRLEGQ